MKIDTIFIRRNIITAVTAAALACGIVSTGAFAGDSETTKTKTTWSWSFHSNTSYGNNQTKGSGVIKEESRPVTNFSQLTLALPANVTITQGATESLTISTDDNLLPLLSTRVVNNELTIEGDKNRGFSTKKEIKIRVTVKSLNAIKIKGSGDVFGDQLKTDKLDISIEGSGDVKFKAIRADDVKIAIVGSGDVSVDTVESKFLASSIRGSGDIKFLSVRASQVSLATTGSGDISAAGSADKVAIDISGSGDVHASKLIAREAEVKVAASGEAEVHATEKLTASVRGSGEIRYAGSPKKIEQVVQGSGTIEAM